MPAARQLELIAWDNPLGARIGAEFFQELPESPGVYRMLSHEAEVLYVGASRNLRQRLGSYRSISPTRHSRRLCRLVHAVWAIPIELTASEAEARALEASWIRHYRPRFNRALNRPLETIWTGFALRGDQLVTRWTNEEPAHKQWRDDFVTRGPEPHRKSVFWLQTLRRTLFWIHANGEALDLRTFPRTLLRWEKPIPQWTQPAPGLNHPSDPTELSRTVLEQANACSEKLTRLPWNQPLVERWEHDQAVLTTYADRSV